MHDPSDHDCRGGVRGDLYPLAEQDEAVRLREALVETLGYLHNIEARAGMIVRWINDPNLNPVEEAEAIRRFRSEAHEHISAALATPPPVPLKGETHQDDPMEDSGLATE